MGAAVCEKHTVKLFRYDFPTAIFAGQKKYALWEYSAVRCCNGHGTNLLTLSTVPLQRTNKECKKTAAAPSVAFTLKSP